MKKFTTVELQTVESCFSTRLKFRQCRLTGNALPTVGNVFVWHNEKKTAYLQGSLMAVGANETVVQASELQEAMRRIKQLEGALDRISLENEIFKEAVDFAKEKSGLRARQYCPGASSEGRLRCP